MRKFQIIEVDNHYYGYSPKELEGKSEDEIKMLISDTGKPGYHTIIYAVKLSRKQLFRALLGKRICFWLTSHRSPLFYTSDRDPFEIPK